MVRSPVRLLLIGTALIAGLAACSSTSNTKSAGSGGALRGEAAAAPAAGSAAQNATADKGKQAPVGLPLQVAGERAIIYNGTMTVRVSDVDTAAAQLAGFATGNGGYVSGDQRSSDAGHNSATLTLRVPVDRFYGTVNSIGRLGQEQSRQISAEDVTAKLVDLTSRLKTQQASVDRIRALMGHANSITDVTTLESELARREADLESLQAQQRDLTNLSTLSTITVTLLRTDAPAAAPKKADSGFLAGLKSGWHAFTGSLRAVLTALGAVLPFAVAVGVPLWLVVAWLRRRRRAPQKVAEDSAASAV
jgi:hypothetical protein